jgi:hypothetical protein
MSVAIIVVGWVLLVMGVLYALAFVFRAIARRRDRWTPPAARYTYRFTGHDETRAAMAASRAHDLDEKRRALALQRAGLGKSALITDLTTFEDARRQA